MKKLFLILTFLFITGSVFFQTIRSVTGNSGTTDFGFVGTGDNMLLINKANIECAGFKDYSRKNNVSSESFALPNVLSRTGRGNIAWGTEALRANTFGIGNIAIGYPRFSNIAIDIRNITDRDNMLYFKALSGYNPIFGYNALSPNIFTNASANGFGTIAAANDQLSIGNRYMGSFDRNRVRTRLFEQQTSVIFSKH